MQHIIVVAMETGGNQQCRARITTGVVFWLGGDMVLGMNLLERFLACMEYEDPDRVPNWELGAWPQTVQRWEAEGLDVQRLHWGWFNGEAELGMDEREFIHINSRMIPQFKTKVLEEDGQTQLIRDAQGRVRRTLKAGAVGGARMSMDTYERFPVENRGDWEELKKRYDPTHPRRYEANWRIVRPAGWAARQHPLILGQNCSTLGFYWMAREWMGTEPLSYAWYDQPELCHDMMEFWADFLIEITRPVLEVTGVEYVCLNEDLAMKTGPLLSPETYREFIYPRLRRVVEFFKSHGVRYVAIDSDGNPELIVPMMMDAGVDILWPLERAAGQDPVRIRKKFGKTLRLWGGVDKRELAKGPEAIDAHLRAMAPLIEEGGFIPSVDHTVPPDIGWGNFRHYMERKRKLLEGRM